MASCGCVALLIFAVLGAVNSQQGGGDPDDPNNPHRNPSKCEVCKLVAIELQGMMDDTGKTREVLELGYRIDREQKKIPYKFSELRLIEALEGVCERIMEYNIHAERKSSRRFAKGMSETFQTLHGLVDKGVKVELGIPYNMWDEPSAPVHTLRKYCDKIVEENEGAIESWFRGNQKKTFIDYLCAERVLSREEADECLSEEWTGVEKVEHEHEKEDESAEDESDSDGETTDDEEDDGAKKKQADLDRKKVQKEIERQAEQQRKREEGDKEKEKQRERDQKKREREMERRRREEDKAGDRKMEKEQDDRRKVEREIKRQAEREQRMREKHGDDYYERRRKDREREREKEREKRRRGGRHHDFEHDLDIDMHMDRYMDDEFDDLRHHHHMDFDADRYVDEIMERERREREERIRHYRNEL